MVGIDILDISRIDNLKRESFYNKVFTPLELAYLEVKHFASQSVAGMYCGKEAVSKALGRGINNGIAFKDIEIAHDSYGKPSVILYNDAKLFLKKLGEKIELSISHTDTIAIAIAIISKKN